jgi:hypothetical protein
LNEKAPVSIGSFSDKTHRPTPDEFLAAVGAAQPAWNELAEFVRSHYTVKEDLGFYGRNYGWALRFRKGGRALVSLYPAQGSFTAQIVLPEALVEAALSLKLGKAVRQVIAQAHPFREGRWLFLPIRAAKDVRDVQRLLSLKSNS